MEDITIRPANLDDLETLLSFEQGVIDAERPFDPCLKDGVVHYYDIKELITANHIEILVAEQSQEIIASGYVRIDQAKAHLKHEKQAYLGFMYVKPESRGQGINKMIVEGLKQWSKKQGVTELRLEVYAQNDAAIRAYEKVGFSNHMIEMRINLEDV